MAIPVEENPLILFEGWYAEARKAAEGADANVMCLSTVDSEGKPWSRMVLLRRYDARGFVFFTNTESPKARHLAENPNVALCLYWPEPGKQVRIQGTAARISNREADAYFATRSRSSQLGAWASAQSEPLLNRQKLEDRFKELSEEYEGKAVPRPPHWSGFRVTPETIEFWLQQPHRLHDRLLYKKKEDGWERRYLYP